MTMAAFSRLLRSRLVGRWALFGAVSAGILISALLILPTLSHPSMATALAGVVTIACGAVVGAVAAILYLVAGRLWFWGIVLVLSVAFLVYGTTSRRLSGPGSPLIWVMVVVAIGLSLWVLLAYGLSVLRRKSR